MTYEEKLLKLQDIIKELENDIPMTRALELYNSGVNIIKESLEELENVKGSIYKVKQDLDNYIEEKMR